MAIKVEIVFAKTTLKIARGERQHLIAAIIAEFKTSENIKRIQRAAEYEFHTIYCNEWKIPGQQIYFWGR